MAKAKIHPLAMDGKLSQAEALAALSAAALAATNALPAALAQCQTAEQMQQVIADRDACQLAYTNVLERSLRHTGPLFEQVAAELHAASGAVNREARQLTSAAEAAGLLSELVRLAAKLALAFA